MINFGFIEFGFKDFLDILLVTFILYYSYRVMKESRSINVFVGILVFVVLWLLVSQVFEMRLLGSILDKVVSVGVIGFIVLFQSEIRRFLYSLGARQRMSPLLQFFKMKKSKKVDRKHIMPIVTACMNMAKEKVGALIIVERSLPLGDLVHAAGEIIDAEINQRLIENIFYKGAPLHDGAMIIADKRIKAAGCVLPVSHSQNIPKELGLRHRAGMGISEESDAIAIIVSEETGRVSVAINGEFHLRLSFEDLESILSKEMG
ncbi:MAG: diadenylate cyclase CdaA [Prevotella sp.]|nr:diadenylate cyclase CdaA [Prevotella sp.]